MNSPTMKREDLALQSVAVPTLTRESLVKIYGVSQGYLGYLLRERKIPLPVRMNGEILWYADEVNSSLPKILPFLERRKKAN